MDYSAYYQPLERDKEKSANFCNITDLCTSKEPTSQV